jgi:hypothetical protein
MFIMGLLWELRACFAVYENFEAINETCFSLIEGYRGGM